MGPLQSTPSCRASQLSFTLAKTHAEEGVLLVKRPILARNMPRAGAICKTRRDRADCKGPNRPTSRIDFEGLDIAREVGSRGLKKKETCLLKLAS